jgi:Zn-finger nucleic acid-binding protein
MNCPRCVDATLDDSDIPTCPRCRGSWISVAEIAKRVRRAQHRWKPTLEWQLDHRGSFACLVCSKPMATLRLFDMPVERCDDHGVWLGRDELGTVAANAGAGIGETGRTFLDAVLNLFWMW